MTESKQIKVQSFKNKARKEGSDEQFWITLPRSIVREIGIKKGEVFDITEIDAHSFKVAREDPFGKTLSEEEQRAKDDAVLSPEDRPGAAQ